MTQNENQLTLYFKNMIGTQTIIVTEKNNTLLTLKEMLAEEFYTEPKKLRLYHRCPTDDLIKYGDLRFANGSIGVFLEDTMNNKTLEELNICNESSFDYRISFV